jgi:hypothetical protein
MMPRTVVAPKGTRAMRAVGLGWFRKALSPTGGPMMTAEAFSALLERVGGAAGLPGQKRAVVAIRARLAAGEAPESILGTMMDTCVA